MKRLAFLTVKQVAHAVAVDVHETKFLNSTTEPNTKPGTIAGISGVFGEPGF